ncbi:MAG: chemotaxis protein CheR [Rhodospirillaceae bacterium]|jgi:chemotaxis protein methyltransferase CheR|nr:chemotaxis protein CheR [Rhodospirillaceae bacterium]
MRPEDFDLLATLVKERSGILLSPEKSYLLETRLLPVARRRGLATLDELAAEVRDQRSEDLADQIVDAMTTNETYFFRDIKPFDQFRGYILPQMMRKRVAKRAVRIWCAGCSTGQEPYSIAMLLKEEGPKLKGWRIEMTATDLSRDALEKARRGRYSQFEVQRGLPVQYLLKYFHQDGSHWQIDRSIQEMVDFRENNLLERSLSLGPFDIVFCRNVLIYFDQPTREAVLERIRKLIPSDGYLMLGATETMIGQADRYRPDEAHPGLFIPN